jgi:DNA polymerase III epsilon subunit-like protein
MGQFKYDMGWQKRGAGRAYDSKSGVGTMIGNLSGKVCGFGVRSKDCRKCTYHINKGQFPPDHKCSKNWDGSSKSMEPDVAAQVVMNIEQNKNVQVGVLIMDDDTTTASKLRETLNHSFVKWSDMNHTRKHLGNSLYALQKKHKCLTTKVIQYIQKCFSYAVAQNKNNSEGLAKALNQIVPHAFGLHENCNDTWCGYINDPEKYKHSSLPYGRDLVGEELRTDLSSIFESFIKNVDKISPAASTKDVESFNNMIASKAPKRCHYSSTSSLQNRVNCVVAEKNLGSTYVSQVNKSIGISPGKFYSKHAERKDNKRKRRLEFENTLTFKKRKIEKKMNKSKQNAQKELREGVTYQSSIDLIGNNETDIIEIPKPISAPEQRKIETNTDCSHVYCDIETTSLYKSCDITQIAAVSGKDNFNQYILPTQPITLGATQVTGLTVVNNMLCYKGKPVHAVSLRTALEQFLLWLEKRNPCVLIGHNFRIFDFPRLVRSFELCNLLTSFQNCVIGFVDTLPLCKEQFPGLDKYSQEYLVKNLMNAQYSAHNALEDVCSLQKLIIYTEIPFDQMCCHSITMDAAIDTYIFEKKADVNLVSLSNMQQEKIVSKQMAMKIAKSGLSLAHLRLAVNRGGRDGLYKLFTEKVNGKVRVTSAKRIIDSVFSYVCPTSDLNL